MEDPKDNGNSTGNDDISRVEEQDFFSDSRDSNVFYEDQLKRSNWPPPLGQSEEQTALEEDNPFGGEESGEQKVTGLDLPGQENVKEPDFDNATSQWFAEGDNVVRLDDIYQGDSSATRVGLTEPPVRDSEVSELDSELTELHDQKGLVAEEPETDDAADAQATDTDTEEMIEEFERAISEPPEDPGEPALQESDIRKYETPASLLPKTEEKPSEERAAIPQGIFSAGKQEETPEPELEPEPETRGPRDDEKTQPYIDLKKVEADAGTATPEPETPRFKKTQPIPSLKDFQKGHEPGKPVIATPTPKRPLPEDARANHSDGHLVSINRVLDEPSGEEPLSGYKIRPLQRPAAAEPEQKQGTATVREITPEAQPAAPAETPKPKEESRPKVNYAATRREDPREQLDSRLGIDRNGNDKRLPIAAEGYTPGKKMNELTRRESEEKPTQPDDYTKPAVFATLLLATATLGYFILPTLQKEYTGSKPKTAEHAKVDVKQADSDKKKPMVSTPGYISPFSGLETTVSEDFDIPESLRYDGPVAKSTPSQDLSEGDYSAIAKIPLDSFVVVNKPEPEEKAEKAAKSKKAEKAEKAAAKKVKPSTKPEPPAEWSRKAAYEHAAERVRENNPISNNDKYNLSPDGKEIISHQGLVNAAYHYNDHNWNAANDWSKDMTGHSLTYFTRNRGKEFTESDVRKPREFKRFGKNRSTKSLQQKEKEAKKKKQRDDKRSAKKKTGTANVEVAPAPPTDLYVSSTAPQIVSITQAPAPEMVPLSQRGEYAVFTAGSAFSSGAGCALAYSPL